MAIRCGGFTLEFNNLSLVKIAVNRGGSVKDREKDVARWVNNAKKPAVKKFCIFLKNFT